MFAIRTLFLGLVAMGFLAPNVATAQERDGSDKKSIIGIVGFEGKKGAHLTAVLKDTATKKAFAHGSVVEIQVIDRSTFDAEVRRFGSEEKAAKALAEKYGLASIASGTADIAIASKEISREGKNCLEISGSVHFNINFINVSGTTKVSNEYVEDANIITVCGGIVIGGYRDHGFGENPISHIVFYSEDSFKSDLNKSGIIKVIDRLFRIQFDAVTPIWSKYDTVIQGSTVIAASAHDVTTTAVDNSVATTTIGSISGSIIHGDTNINASVGTSVHADGSNSCASTNIGSININPCHRDSVTSVAIGNQSYATANQGVIGVPRDGVGGGASQSAIRPGMAEPPFFPWPPPAPSLFGEVTLNFRIVTDLAAINAQVGSLLHRQGYDSLHYFGVDGGFVVTTDLERIESDGRSAAKDRWLIGKAGHPNSFSEYVSNLIFGEKGRFRLFAFIVGSHEPSAASFAATEQDTQRWKATGAMTLSAQTGARGVDSGTRVWLYVYEFESSLEKSVTIVPLADHAVSFAAHKHSLGLR